MSEVSNCNTASSDKFEKEELIQKFISINSVALLELHNLLLFGSPKVSFCGKTCIHLFLKPQIRAVGCDDQTIAECMLTSK